jgi:hypothetical protein
LEKLRIEFQLALDQKADIEMVHQIQAKKLDISVFDTSFWDFKKFRNALEQNTQDLYANFALQMENKINSKISIEDFNRFFHFEDGGSSSTGTTLLSQKTSFEMAAQQISKMKEQLQAIQEYIQNDQERQSKIADLNVNVLDLVRKQHASRNQITQLTTSIEKLQNKAQEKEELQKKNQMEEQITQKIQQEIKNYTFDQGPLKKIFIEMDKNKKMSTEMIKSLEQIQQFTEKTLIKGFDGKLQQQMIKIQDFVKEEMKQNGLQYQHKTKETNVQIPKIEEQIIRLSNSMIKIEENMDLLKENLHQTKEELAYVKGPLVTVATNLKEENVAILREIQRSQNESREILLEYKEKISNTQNNTSFRGSSMNVGRRMSRSSQLTSSNISLFSNLSTDNPHRPPSTMSMYYNQGAVVRPVSSSSSIATSNNDGTILQHRPSSSCGSVSETIPPPTGSSTNKTRHRARSVFSPAVTTKPIELDHHPSVGHLRSSSSNGSVLQQQQPANVNADGNTYANGNTIADADNILTNTTTGSKKTHTNTISTTNFASAASEQMDFNIGTTSQSPIENAFLLDDKEGKTHFTRGGTLSFSFIQRKPEDIHFHQSKKQASEEEVYEDESELFDMDDDFLIQEEKDNKREIR